MFALTLSASHLDWCSSQVVQNLNLQYPLPSSVKETPSMRLPMYVHLTPTKETPSTPAYVHLPLLKRPLADLLAYTHR